MFCSFVFFLVNCSFMPLIHFSSGIFFFSSLILKKDSYINKIDLCSYIADIFLISFCLLTLFIMVLLVVIGEFILVFLLFCYLVWFGFGLIAAFLFPFKKIFFCICVMPFYGFGLGVILKKSKKTF